MTAPEWAVEAFDAATDAATGASVKYKPSAREAAALELSRRCVPIEEYQRVVGMIQRWRDSLAITRNSPVLGDDLSGHELDFVIEQLDNILAREVWKRGVQLLPFTAALKETGNAD